jgi:hypothetical protein
MGKLFGWLIFLFIIFLAIANPSQFESFGESIISDISSAITKISTQATTPNTTDNRAPTRSFRLN